MIIVCTPRVDAIITIDPRISLKLRVKNEGTFHLTKVLGEKENIYKLSRQKKNVAVDDTFGAIAMAMMPLPRGKL